jgi:hypothetical protein
MKQRRLVRTVIAKAGRVFGIAAATVFLTQGAMAECAATYCDDVRILTLYTAPAPDYFVYIKVAGTTANLNCSLYGGVYVKVPTDSPRFKEYYATLLAAQMADRLVSFGIVAGSSPCTMNSIYTNSP